MIGRRARAALLTTKNAHSPAGQYKIRVLGRHHLLGICFVHFQDGQTTFKRVFFECGEKGASVLRLQPRNEKYRPQVVPSENITGLYRAVYRYQRVGEE